MKRFRLDFLTRLWVGSALLILALPPLFSQEELRPPVQPKPVENWRPPQAPRLGPRTVLPQLPPEREVEPLSGRVEPGIFLPSVQRDPLRPIPEEPPVAEEETRDWEELLAQTLRPALLAVPNRLTVIRDGVTLREGPGLDFPRVGTLLQGDSIRRLDTDDDWHRVEIASGTEGWVYSRLTRPVEERPAVVTGERVNLRSAPSRNGLVLGALYRGAIVMAGEPDGEWVRIRTPNLEEAYVASLYLRNLPPNRPPNPPLLEYASHSDKPVASLAVVEETSSETAYLLAVWEDEWVKGGKIGLLHLASEKFRPVEMDPSTETVFTEGTFFESSLHREDFERTFATTVGLPPDIETATVAYLRGRKKDRIWLFEFAVARPYGGGRFAMVRQEGTQTGSFLLLEEKR